MRPWVVKFARADELLHLLEVEVEEYLARGAASLVVERVATDPTLWELRLRLRRQPPWRWSAIAGDVLHNVRSALDSLIYALLVERSSQPLTDRQRKVAQLPITQDEASFRKYDWHAGSADDELVAAVAALQPWHDIRGLGFSANEVADVLPKYPLSLLQRWSNIDKHRTLHTAVAGLDALHMGLPAGATSNWQVADPWPWRDGSVVLRVRVVGLAPSEEPEFGFRFTVALEEDVEPLRAPPMIGRLQTVRWHADFVASRLQPLLPTGE